MKAGSVTVIGSGISETDWLEQKRREAEHLLPFGHFRSEQYGAPDVARRKVAQPNYAALGITDPEGQN